MHFFFSFHSPPLVIFIDFNFDGKIGGEKAHRSLDQVQYQDGGIRGRSTFTDSYGNPVAYDTLDDVDAQKPSNNKDNPFQYVIPGMYKLNSSSLNNYFKINFRLCIWNSSTT